MIPKRWRVWRGFGSTVLGIISKERCRPEATVRPESGHTSVSLLGVKAVGLPRVGWPLRPRSRTSPPPHAAAGSRRGRWPGIAASGRPSHGHHSASCSKFRDPQHGVHTTEPCEVVVGVIPRLTSGRSARLWPPESSSRARGVVVGGAHVRGTPTAATRSTRQRREPGGARGGGAAATSEKAEQGRVRSQKQSEGPWQR